MPDLTVTNLDHPLRTPLRASTCATPMCHLFGLSFRKTIPADWGLLFDNRRDTRFDTTMHSMWMRFTIGMVWITEAGEVVDKMSVRPWKLMLRPERAARYVLELLPERLEEFYLGDTIKFEEVD